jgi:hypothetical protein
MSKIAFGIAGLLLLVAAETNAQGVPVGSPVWSGDDNFVRRLICGWCNLVRSELRVRHAEKMEYPQILVTRIWLMHHAAASRTLLAGCKVQ